MIWVSEPGGMVHLEFFSRQAKESGFDEADYLAAIVEAPVMPRDKLASRGAA